MTPIDSTMVTSSATLTCDKAFAATETAKWADVARRDDIGNEQHFAGDDAPRYDNSCQWSNSYRRRRPWMRPKLSVEEALQATAPLAATDIANGATLT